MNEAVHGGAREKRITEESREFIDGAVAGEDDGAALVSQTDDLVEVEWLVALQRPKSEVVDDEYVGCETKQPRS